MQQIGGNGKKPSRNRRYRPGKGRGAAVEKTKLEPEETFVETGPSRLELVVPTMAILTVIGIIPFVGAVARAHGSARAAARTAVQRRLHVPLHANGQRRDP